MCLKNRSFINILEKHPASLFRYPQPQINSTETRPGRAGGGWVSLKGYLAQKVWFLPYTQGSLQTNVQGLCEGLPGHAGSKEGQWRQSWSQVAKPTVILSLISSNACLSIQKGASPLAPDQEPWSKPSLFRNPSAVCPHVLLFTTRDHPEYSSHHRFQTKAPNTYIVKFSDKIIKSYLLKSVGSAYCSENAS